MFIKDYYRRKKLILFLFFLCSILFLTSPIILSLTFLPEKINIIAGKEEQLSFHAPVFAAFEADENTINGIKINQQPIKDNIHINLNKNFTILSEKEGSVDMNLSLFGVIPLKKMVVSVMPEMNVIPMGVTVGVRINTDGIMVLGTGFVNSEDKGSFEPAKDILKSGDLITAVNGTKIESKESLIDQVNKSKGETMYFSIKRDNQTIETEIVPAKCVDDGNYKIGVWVRDSTQGIGTITYYNPETKKFGSLGHGIMDIDTSQLMSIKEGNIIASEIRAVKKGKKGVPGELIGRLDNQNILGNIKLNTPYGIYGYLNKSDVISSEKMPIGLQSEVKEGSAYILSNVDGKNVQKFEVEIQSVNKYSNDDSKGMVIKITDKQLLDITGGIVQGMSGSPIIQNNKIVGAITHVFVQDPQRGYGIFIENMLKQEESV